MEVIGFNLHILLDLKWSSNFLKTLITTDQL